MTTDPPPQVLPDDVLEEEVLCRLPPRALAVCRCVCRAWRAAIDARRMLRPDLLPLSPCGVFLELADVMSSPLFFAPPWMGRNVAIDFESYIETDSHWEWDVAFIFSCCNGLLLLDEHVVNPATGWWARVPPCPIWSCYHHLLFDPLLSPHYQVLVIQARKDCQREALDESTVLLDEWPPSPYLMCVYSSTTGRWEKTWFAREGAPAGTLAEVLSDQYHYHPSYDQAVYCHGALYVYAHCKTDFTMRITLSNCKYQVIMLPEGVDTREHYLGKSKDGVYLAFIYPDEGQLHVWFLNESSGKEEWVLKYDVDLKPALNSHFSEDRNYPISKPWILHGVSYNRGEERRPISNNNFEWDFDNVNIVEISDTKEKWRGIGNTTIIGFHPCKEVAFFHLDGGRVVACHLDGSKVQDLGELHVPYGHGRIHTFFVYSPCRMGQLAQLIYNNNHF